MVLIAGTGSNCVLLEPINTVRSVGELVLASSGGWGCLLGDEGSGNTNINTHTHKKGTPFCNQKKNAHL